MESLVLDILPDLYDWLSGYVASIFGFMGAGILVAFIFWTVAFTIDAVFTWIRNNSGM